VLLGNDGLGHLVAEEAMQHAIRLAGDEGVGIVCARESNHFGAASYYVVQAADSMMIAFALSNSAPKVAGYGGIVPILGTNPLAFAAPRRNGQHLIVDMATSSTAGSSIRLMARDGEELEEGMAIDSKGNAISDAEEAASSTLLPFGGAKGWGIMLIVEVLAGVLAGAGIGEGVKSIYRDLDDSGHNGHLFAAISVDRFLSLDEWFNRMESLVDLIQKANESAPGQSVRIPGEARWMELQRSDQLGVEVDNRTVKELTDLARRYALKFPFF
jgi:LDH2 family malate/lactate/ureidoglycolate dehydrogenase